MNQAVCTYTWVWNAYVNCISLPLSCLTIVAVSWCEYERHETGLHSTTINAAVAILFKITVELWYYGIRLKALAGTCCEHQFERKCKGFVALTSNQNPD